MDEKPDWRIDALIAAILVPLQMAAILHPNSVGENALLTGIYLQLIGVLFVVSYFYPNRSYVLKGADVVLRAHESPGTWSMDGDPVGEFCLCDRNLCAAARLMPAVNADQ